jgi:hypothetical protein
MSLRRITLQLENGLKIKLKLLNSRESDEVYAKYITTSDPRIFKKDIYQAVFEFEARRLYAFCYADAVSLIMKLFGEPWRTRALDHFECFILDTMIIRAYDPDGKRSQFLNLLKLSVEHNLAPSITALLGEEATKATS